MQTLPKVIFGQIEHKQKINTGKGFGYVFILSFILRQTEHYVCIFCISIMYLDIMYVDSDLAYVPAGYCRLRDCPRLSCSAAVLQWLVTCHVSWRTCCSAAVPGLHCVVAQLTSCRTPQPRSSSPGPLLQTAVGRPRPRHRGLNNFMNNNYRGV